MVPHKKGPNLAQLGLATKVSTPRRFHDSYGRSRKDYKLIILNPLLAQHYCGFIVLYWVSMSIHFWQIQSQNLPEIYRYRTWFDGS